MFDANLVLQNVPKCMIEPSRWVGWKEINRDGKLTKAPIDPHTGNFADSTNPATWGTFEQAMSACARFTTLAGVGFVFTADDEFAGIDLDDCVVPETGEVKAWAKAIIERFNSYTEISPSGTGAKIFIKGHKPGEGCRTAWQGGEIELYDQARFFAVTGQIVDGVSQDVEARQEQLDALYAEVFGVPKDEAAVGQNPGQQKQAPVILSDDEIIRLASSEKRKGGRGEKFAALWNGQWNSYFNSPSEADSSVVFTLAYYTKDANQIDRLFRQSKLFRPKWMEELFGDDAEAIDALQEMFGYYLLPDTAQQKIGLIVGPKRSGKGTIGRVLTGVLGRANVCGSTLGSLGTNFGLWPLLHKQLAIISDARLSGRTDQAVVVERLLSISGEDTITVDRKHLTPWTGKLPTRFLILTNELPKLNDASGALAGRFILLCLTHSWFGREDQTLTDRLLADLPGILNWAIAGWRRLRDRGYFVQPASSQEAIGQVEDLGSPIGAFIRDRCQIGLSISVEVNELFAAWQDYCRDTGRANAGTIQGFGRDLRAALPGLRVSQPRAVGGRVRFYEGISLRPDEQLAATGTHGTRCYPLHV